jgi:hypothetical protein
MNLCRATVAAGATVRQHAGQKVAAGQWRHNSIVIGEITHRPVASMQVDQRILQIGQLQLLDHALDQLGLADRC